MAICRDGQVVKAAGHGLASVELEVPTKPETVFQSGSVGKLGLADPLPKHFPGAPPAWKNIVSTTRSGCRLSSR